MTDRTNWRCTCSTIVTSNQHHVSFGFCNTCSNSAYAGFTYGLLDWQADPSKVYSVPWNPVSLEYWVELLGAALGSVYKPRALNSDTLRQPSPQ